LTYTTFFHLAKVIELGNVFVNNIIIPYVLGAEFVSSLFSGAKTSDVFFFFLFFVILTNRSAESAGTGVRTASHGQ